MNEIINFFENKHNDILKVIEIFVSQNKNEGFNEELIEFLLTSKNLKEIEFYYNDNYNISIEILEKYYDYIQINCHNYLGNSILHILFMNKNFEKISSNYYHLEKIYELMLKIMKKNKKLILSKNREFNTPFILAANSACNMALTIMSEIYSIQYLEEIN